MVGFTGVVSSEVQLINSYQRQIKSSGIELGFTSNGKFDNDKIFIETDTYIIGIDGVILNLKEICKGKVWHEFLIDCFENNPTDFPLNFKGVFCGFIYHKANKDIRIFNDHCSVKKLFYYADKNHFIFSSSLQEITALLTNYKLSYALNYRAAYSLLSYGGLVENDSLVKEIQKLYPAEIVQYDSHHKLKQFRYYDYNHIDLKEQSKQTVIDRLDEKFNTALQLEYDKDLEYGYQHFTTLSGGLDSRMNVMLSAKQGYQNRTNLCFSQSNYLDESIAKEISRDLKDTHIQIPLDSAEFVRDIVENGAMTDYQSAYGGAAHLNFALNTIEDFSSFGIIHSGLIGDGILCGFISEPTVKKPNIRTGLVSDMFFPKIESEIAALSKNYKSEDIFQLYYRVFGITITGCFTTEHRSYMLSPFMEKDFLDYSLSIHPKYRYNSGVYIDWINNKHKELTRYIWEKTKTRPTPFHVNYTSYLYRIERKLKAMLGNKTANSMNPYQYWFQTKPELYEFYNSFYREHLQYLDGDTELKRDLEKMFSTNNIQNKVLVLSLLNGIKQLGIKI